MAMKRVVPILACAALLVGLCLLLRTQIHVGTLSNANKDVNPATPATGVVVTTVAKPAASSQPTRLLGEKILSGYADTNRPPENDLTLMSHLMENFTLLLKSAANRPLSANEDWAAALRGQNAAHERFLPDQHIAFNESGQIVDRWGTPLFFHSLGGGRYQLHSAGPDKELWTKDDIQRNADGTIQHGSQLEPQRVVSTAMNR
jgi:hypothetical protein